MTPNIKKSGFFSLLSFTAPYIYGVAVISISLIVILGWIIESQLLVQLSTRLPPMQFNTALCFLLVGTSICLLDHPKKYLLFLIASAVTLISSVTVLEHMAGVSLGIDTAFVTPFTTELAPEPGRMGLDTAICFVLISMALMASARVDPLIKYFNNVVVILISSIVLSVSLLQMLVHLSNVEPNTIFGGFSFMSIQTCIAFIISCIGLIIHTYSHVKDPHHLLPIPVFFGIFSATIYLTILMNSYADYRLRTIIAAKTSLETQKLSYRVNQLFRSLDRLQLRLSGYKSLGQRAEQDIQIYLNDYQGLMPGIALIDAEEGITWFLGKNQTLAINDMYINSLIANNQDRSLVNNDWVVVTDNAYSEKPEESVLLYIDGIKHESSVGRYLVSAINLNTLITNLKINDEVGRYYLTVSIDGKQIFQDAGKISDKLKQWGEVATIEILGLKWKLELYPTESLVKEFYSRIPVMSLIVGFFISLLTALSVYFGLKSKQDSVRLRDNQKYLQAILDGSAHSIIATEIDGTISLFNKAAEKMLGYSASEVIGKYTPEILHDKYEVGKRSRKLSRELGCAIEPGFQTFIAKLDASDVDENEWLYVRKDGSKFPVFLSVYKLMEGDKPRGYVGIAQDISDRKALEATKNEFISAVSHELRTPLTAIRGSIGLLLGGAVGNLDGKVVEMLNVAYKNCERLIRLINDILDIEKIEAGKMSYRYSDVNVNDLLEEVVEANKTLGLSNSIHIKLTKSKHNIVVVADRDRLNQVFTNLISNAIKFSEPCTTVNVKVNFHKGKVIVSVRDRGMGISETDKKRVFEKFMQVDPTSTRRKGGTGLGLSISQKIVEQMHGYINLRSKLGIGTTFFVTFVAFKYDDYVSEENEEQENE